MSEIPQEQLQSTENVDIQDNKIQTESTIEDVLKQKIPDDISKQQLFLEIFNQPIFTNLPQKSVDNELSQANIIFEQQHIISKDVQKEYNQR